MKHFYAAEYYGPGYYRLVFGRFDMGNVIIHVFFSERDRKEWIQRAKWANQRIAISGLDRVIDPGEHRSIPVYLASGSEYHRRI